MQLSVSRLAFKFLVCNIPVPSAVYECLSLIRVITNSCQKSTICTSNEKYHTHIEYEILRPARRPFQPETFARIKLGSNFDLYQQAPLLLMLTGIADSTGKYAILSAKV